MKKLLRKVKNIISRSLWGPVFACFLIIFFLPAERAYSQFINENQNVIREWAHDFFQEDRQFGLRCYKHSHFDFNGNGTLDTGAEEQAYEANKLPLDGYVFGDVNGPIGDAIIQMGVCNYVKTTSGNGSDWIEPAIRVAYKIGGNTSTGNLSHGECQMLRGLRFCARFAVAGEHGNRTDRPEFGPPRVLLCAYEDPQDGQDTKRSYSPNHYRTRDDGANLIRKAFGDNIKNHNRTRNLGCVNTPLAIGPPPWSNDQWNTVEVPNPLLTYGGNTDFFNPIVDLLFCQKDNDRDGNDFQPSLCLFKGDGFGFYEQSVEGELQYGHQIGYIDGIRLSPDGGFSLNPHAGRNFEHAISVNLNNVYAGHNSRGAYPTVEFTARITKDNPSKVCVSKTRRTTPNPVGGSTTIDINQLVGCIDRPGYMPLPEADFDQMTPADIATANILENGDIDKDYEAINVRIEFPGDPYNQVLRQEDIEETPFDESTLDFIQVIEAFDQPSSFNSGIADTDEEIRRRLNMRCGYLHQIPFCLTLEDEVNASRLNYSIDLTPPPPPALPDPPKPDDSAVCLTGYDTPPQVVVENSDPARYRTMVNNTTGIFPAGFPYDNLSSYTNNLPPWQNTLINKRVDPGDIIYNHERYHEMDTGTKRVEEIINGPNILWYHAPLKNDDGTNIELAEDYNTATPAEQAEIDDYNSVQEVVGEVLNGVPRYLMRNLQPRELALCDKPYEVPAADQLAFEEDQPGNYSYTIPPNCGTVTIRLVGAGSSGSVQACGGQGICTGAAGAYAEAVGLSVDDGDTINVVIGEGGNNNVHDLGSSRLSNNVNVAPDAGDITSITFQSDPTKRIVLAGAGPPSSRASPGGRVEDCPICTRSDDGQDGIYEGSDFSGCSGKKGEKMGAPAWNQNGAIAKVDSNIRCPKDPQNGLTAWPDYNNFPSVPGVGGCVYNKYYRNSGFGGCGPRRLDLDQLKVSKGGHGYVYIQCDFPGAIQ